MMIKIISGGQTGVDRAALDVALELGLPFTEMPGAHLAPQRNPAKFAAALKDLLNPEL